MRPALPELSQQSAFEEGARYFDWKPGTRSYFQATAYDTNIFVSGGDDYDFFHHFDLFDRKILWINSVTSDVGGEPRTVMARTVFPCNENDFDGHIVAHRFASLVGYTARGAIHPRIWVGGAYPVPNTTQPAEKYLGIRITPQDIDNHISRLDIASFTDKRWIALAHYRQAMLALTPYYEVLSFWKILELYFENNKPAMNAFINEQYRERPDWFDALGSLNMSAASKLKEVRHASAHFQFFGSNQIEDPDNPDLFNLVSNSLFAFKRITEKLIDSPSGW